MKKIFWLLFAVACLSLLFSGNHFFESFNIKLIAKERMVYIHRAADLFFYILLISSCFLLAIANIMAFQQKQNKWLLIPLFFFIAGSFTHAWFLEVIFKFRKSEGLWEGGFSLSFIAAIVFSGIAFIVLLVNRLILSVILKKKQSAE